MDELAAWVATSGDNADVVSAKEQYFERTGPVFDDDRQLEQRMVGFVEHYVCDRPLPREGVSPARLHFQRAVRGETPERAAGFAALTQSRHSLFEVVRLRDGEVLVSALLSGLYFSVVERRSLPGIKAGAIIECRLIPTEGSHCFSDAWCVHPQAAAPFIKKRALALARAGRDEATLVDECAQRSLKVDRYRQIPIARIYSFDEAA